MYQYERDRVNLLDELPITRTRGCAKMQVEFLRLLYQIQV